MSNQEKPLILPRAAAAAAEAKRRVIRRRVSNPGITIEPTDTGWVLGAPHRDVEAWQSQILDAFGTNSQSAAWTFIGHLTGLCSVAWNAGTDRRQPSEQELNAALNLVASMRPSNETEAALAAQMVAVHWMTMKMAAKVLELSSPDPRMAAVAGKLARTFVQQAEAMTKLKGRAGRQRITVKSERHLHQHVHVHEGGGAQKNGEQAHAPKALRAEILRRRVDRATLGEPGGEPALLGQDKTRNPMPRADRER